MDDLGNKDYIIFAKMKGISKTRLFFMYELRSVLVMVLEKLPLQIIVSVSASVLIESLYSVPGIGNLLVTSIKMMDNNLVQALILLISICGVILYFISDMLMLIINPRIKINGDFR
jgi:oligopeptide transport system permease protein